MADQLTPDDYREQLSSLLPRGPAWTREPASVLQRLLAGIALSLQRLDAAALRLLVDARPTTTFSLLPDWERAVGLPDDCSGLSGTIAARRAAVSQKLSVEPDAGLATYARLARSYGVEILVKDLDQVRAEAILGLDTSNGRWRFVWWIQIPTSADIRRFTTLSTANERLTAVERDLELECRLQKVSPAHTLLIIGYVEME